MLRIPLGVPQFKPLFDGPHGLKGLFCHRSLSRLRDLHVRECPSTWVVSFIDCSDRSRAIMYSKSCPLEGLKREQDMFCPVEHHRRVSTTTTPLMARCCCCFEIENKTANPTVVEPTSLVFNKLSINYSSIVCVHVELLKERV